MLPKNVYSKVIQSLKKMKTDWDEDRKENPSTVPYEIDSQLTMSIENHMREGHVHCSRQERDRLVKETFEYLCSRNMIVKSPYGGHMFPIPKDMALPTREELIEQTKKQLGLN